MAGWKRVNVLKMCNSGESAAVSMQLLLKQKYYATLQERILENSYNKYFTLRTKDLWIFYFLAEKVVLLL